MKRPHIFLLFSFAFLLSYFYRSTNAIIAQDLSRDLSLNAAQLGMMTSLYFITFALVQVPLGITLDRWGPRWVTPGLMLVTAVGSMTFSRAESLFVLALGRALIGMGLSGVLMGGMKAFSLWYPVNIFATLSGLMVGIGSSGALLAATPLALLNQWVGWRAVFEYGSYLLVAHAALMMLTIPSLPVKARGERKESGSLRSVVSSLQFWQIAPLIFFLCGTIMAFQGLWAGPYLFDVIGLDKFEAGNILLVLSIGATSGYLFSGWLSDRLGIYRIILSAGVMMMFALLLLIIRPALPVVTLAYFILGVSGGFHVMLLAQTRLVFPSEVTGRAVSTINTFAIGGAFLLQILMGVFINSWSNNAAGGNSPEAYSKTLLLVLVGLAAAFVWYLPIGKNYARLVSNAAKTKSSSAD